MWQQIVGFFNHPFFIIVGALSSIVMISGFLITLWKVLRGNLPVWFRLGMGLYKRKIAVFAESELLPLKNMLLDSKLFNKDNIIEIDKSSLNRSESASLHLVYWPEFGNRIDEILHNKKDRDAMIVYCPAPERIDDHQMAKINMKRNVFVVNFRGRPLNDILIAMMTTACR